MIPSGKAKIAGVMGWPITHSKSPRLHGYWLNQYNIDGAYIPMAVRPEDTIDAVKMLPRLGLRGCNLTIPHKENVLPCLDEIDPLASRVGAVNTVVVREDGSLEGQNTDVYGFSENLRSAGFQTPRPEDIVTVLGAGGAARAVVVALQDMGFSTINIVNRDQARALTLAESLEGETTFAVFSWDDCARALEGSNLLVNTTSLGMVGQPELSIDLSPLAAESWVTDAVYAPLETALLKQAKEKGLKTVDGLGMLLYQAVPGFESWFGVKPEVTPELRSFVLGEQA